MSLKQLFLKDPWFAGWMEVVDCLSFFKGAINPSLASSFPISNEQTSVDEPRLLVYVQASIISTLHDCRTLFLSLNLP